MKRDIVYIAVILALIACNVATLQRSCKSDIVQYETKVIERVDTFIDTVPKLVFAKLVRYQPIPKEVLRTDTVNDTIQLSVPIEQRVYEDSTYRAYVSGFNCSLDSLFIYKKETIVERYNKPKKWNIGVQGGVGLTPKGVQPYIGIGIQYNIRF